ncbi:hypothetical protein AJ80_01561 [Polytolypa hystricis UAMH7299]|uniref:Geranylgeranyl pyrophosphate synthase n=1 Tax=Polytolypa hystricis (strain UAMH7299) TaxID=1447883 RepID=A0A2B7YZM9_POLH7|nr:hypothetical protein AJ80_01561 [Polytolypa hystricis UAMH7299]
MPALFPTISFSYSVPGDPEHELPLNYFSTIPFRTAKDDKELVKTAELAAAEWAQATGKDYGSLLKSGGLTARGHALRWFFPEMPPDRLSSGVKLFDTTLFWDDANDVLGLKEHAAAVDDFILGYLLRQKQGKLDQFEFASNKLMADATFGVPGIATTQNIQLILSLVKSQPVKTRDMSFESYKKFRKLSVGGMMMVKLVPVAYGIDLSDQERSSVEHFLDKLPTVVALLNDLYSFDREFIEHTNSGSLGMIQNAMAVLMSRYGYSKTEAEDILKKEISTIEKKIMDDYISWEYSSTHRSENLRNYVAYTILAVGGIIHWTSHSERYQTHNSKVCIDFTQLLPKDLEGLEKLEGYPPPALVTQARGDTQCEGLKQDDAVEPTSVNGALDASEQHSLKCDLYAPFKKAPAREIALAPYKYTESLSGKNTLAKFTHALQVWFNVPSDPLETIKKGVTMLFNSSLLLDDIEDGSPLRRGRPAAHVLYGPSQTFNSATYAVLSATILLDSLAEGRHKHVYKDELENLNLGQSLDLYWRFHSTCPSIDEYITMVDNKTGSFFRLVVRLMEAETSRPSNPALLHFITLLGRYYQIRDDYKNLSEEYTATKGYCDDISEGKLSLQVIHFLQQHDSPSTDQVRGLLFRQRTDVSKEGLSPELKAWIVSEIKTAGSLDYVLGVLDDMHDRIMETLEKLEGELGANKKLKILMVALRH